MHCTPMLAVITSPPGVNIQSQPGRQTLTGRTNEQTGAAKRKVKR